MKVYLGIPCYAGTIYEGTARTVALASANNSVGRCTYRPTSLLTRGMNRLFSDALNLRDEGYTHFCLLHADIVALRPFWVDSMLNLMNLVKADVLSVVSPMKDTRGLTTTAIDVDPETGKKDKWRVKRLTMKEIFQRDPTFTEEGLLVNTGMMLVDLSHPDITALRFRFLDEIEIDPKTRKYRATGMSEDWDFSRQCNDLGMRIFATREIPISHIGPAAFGNEVPWGEWETDKEPW